MVYQGWISLEKDAGFLWFLIQCWSEDSEHQRKSIKYLWVEQTLHNELIVQSNRRVGHVYKNGSLSSMPCGQKMYMHAFLREGKL